MNTLDALVRFGLLVAMWTYWPSVYADLRLQELGFDPLGMSEFERMANVPASAQEEASRIYESQMGIGWPLRALFLLPLVAIYACIVVAITRFWRRRVAGA